MQRRRGLVQNMDMHDVWVATSNVMRRRHGGHPRTLDRSLACGENGNS